MSETPSTYSCGDGCTCDAVTDLASERTELMEEMAAALRNAADTLTDMAAGDLCGLGAQHNALWAAMAIDAVLAKYHDR